MRKLSKNLRKRAFMSSVVACTLLFGAMGVGAEANASTTTVKQTATKHVSKATVSKKGIMSFSKSFNKKKVINELKPEAAKLIKVYADTLKTGKTKSFYTYIDKHVIDSSIFKGSRKNTKDSYKISIKNTKRYSTKKKTIDFANGLKKVKTSKLKMEQSYSKGYSANFSYEYKPAGFYNGVKVSFMFIQSNGKYVLTAVHFY
ncbi:hypothetical protein ACQKCU_19715 [Heyndrickxia sporothermodurans]